MRTFLALLSLAFAAALPAHAAEDLRLFDGDWAAEGVAFKKPAAVSMRWRPVLGGAATEIAYRIETKNEKGETQTFEGIGLYRQKTAGGFDGAWFDSQGAMHPLSAALAGDTLTTHWGVKGETYGRTTYRRDGDAVEVVDAIMSRDGAWREFSRNTLRRKVRD